MDACQMLYMTLYPIKLVVSMTYNAQVSSKAICELTCLFLNILGVIYVNMITDVGYSYVLGMSGYFVTY